VFSEDFFSFEGKVVDEAGAAVPGAVAALLARDIESYNRQDGIIPFRESSGGKIYPPCGHALLGLEDYRLTVRIPLSGPGPLKVVMKERVYESDEVVVVHGPRNISRRRQINRRWFRW